MNERDPLRQLRAVIAQGDGPGLLSVLNQEPWSALCRGAGPTRLGR